MQQRHSQTIRRARSTSWWEIRYFGRSTMIPCVRGWWECRRHGPSLNYRKRRWNGRILVQQQLSCAIRGHRFKQEMDRVGSSWTNVSIENRSLLNPAVPGPSRIHHTAVYDEDVFYAANSIISVSIVCSSLIVVLSERRSSSTSSSASEVDWDDEKFEHRKLKSLNRTRRRFLPMNIESGDLCNGVIKVCWWWLCNRCAFYRIACVHRRAPAVLTSIRWQSTDRLASIRLVNWVIIYNRSKKWFYFRCSIMTYSTSLIWHRHEVSFSMDNLVSFFDRKRWYEIDFKALTRHC